MKIDNPLIAGRMWGQSNVRKLKTEFEYKKPHQEPREPDFITINESRFMEEIYDNESSNERE